MNPDSLFLFHTSRSSWSAATTKATNWHPPAHTWKNTNYSLRIINSQAAMGAEREIFEINMQWPQIGRISIKMPVLELAFGVGLAGADVCGKKAQRTYQPYVLLGYFPSACIIQISDRRHRRLQRHIHIIRKLFSLHTQLPGKCICILGTMRSIITVG